jgi:TDG/mug DNA glycosylase family protein
MELPRPPTRQELEAARGKTVPDVIAPDLRVLFCGINPGLYTAAIGHHFGRPGNRFWPTLHRAGFTERLLSPYEERELLPLGYGITNVVDRATAAAEELSAKEFVEGGRRLRAKLRKFRPRALAVLGVGAYRAAFSQPKAAVGLQSEPLEGSAVWVLPNPSGLNANYQMDRLIGVFTQLRRAVERMPASHAVAKEARLRR